MRRTATVAALVGAGTLAVAGIGLPCPLAVAAHVPCPMCGMSRAMHLVATGHLGDAVRVQPLAPVLLVLLGALAASCVLGVARYDDATRFISGRRARAWSGAFSALAVSLVFVWIARFAGGLGGPVSVFAGR